MRNEFDKNKIQFALVDNKITHIKDITKNDIATCLECGEKLIIRDGTKNIKHLAHVGDTDCKYHREIEYCNESYQHKYVKNYINENVKIFKKVDAIIGNSREIPIIESKLEYTKLKQELDLENMYIPDVLLVTSEGYICLEIYKTNKKDTEHIKNILYPRNIQVYEININDLKIEELNAEDIYCNAELIYDASLIAYKEKEFEIKTLTKYNLEQEFILQEKELQYKFEKYNKKLKYEFELKEKKLQYEHIEMKKRLRSEAEKKKNESLENLRIIVKAVCRKSFDKFRDTIKQDIRIIDNEFDKRRLENLLKSYNGIVGAFISNLGLEKLEKILRIHKIYYSNRDILLENSMNNDNVKKQTMIWKELITMIDLTNIKEFKELNKMLK